MVQDAKNVLINNNNKKKKMKMLKTYRHIFFVFERGDHSFY